MQIASSTEVRLGIVCSSHTSSIAWKQCCALAFKAHTVRLPFGSRPEKHSKVTVQYRTAAVCSERRSLSACRSQRANSNFVLPRIYLRKEARNQVCRTIDDLSQDAIQSINCVLPKHLYVLVAGENAVIADGKITAHMVSKNALR